MGSREEEASLEAITLVCDVCGKLATDTVMIKVGERNHLKDLCTQHLGELLQNTRAPRRGRPKVITTAGKKGSATAPRVRPKRPSAAPKTRKTRTAKAAGIPARRGRPRKTKARAAK
jgi:hypothetical protein